MGSDVGLDRSRTDATPVYTDAIALSDGESYVRVNQPFADQYGFSEPVDLVGTAWERSFAPDERTRFHREILPAVRDDGQWDGTVTGRRRDGSTFLHPLSIVMVETDRFVCRNGRPLSEQRNGAIDRDSRQLIDRALDSVDHVRDAEDGAHEPHESRGRTFEEPGSGASHRDTVARDAGDRTERELRTARLFTEELVENAPFGMFRLDSELRITYENPRAEEIIGLPNELSESAAIGEDIRELPSIAETGEAELFSRLRDGETIEFEFPFESIYGAQAYFTGRGVPLYRDGQFDGAILMAIDISERRRHERDLERQRDELATLDRINELVLEITRNLFVSPTRNDIEQTVCDSLAASELYQFAWTGAPDADGHRIVPRTTAGIDDGYVESATITETDTGRGPGGRAYRTGELQVSQDIRSDPTFEPWRDETLDRGIKAAAAIPLVHGDTTYGILAVYATRPLAFSRREQAGFETLGNAVGFAINAIENRKLLFADAVVELEFEVADSDLAFVRTSERLECDLTVTECVESTSGTWTVYLDVDGATPEAVRSVATEDPDIAGARVIVEEGTSGVLECTIDGQPLGPLAEPEAVLTSGRVSNGRGRFCIEVPRSADVHRLTSRLRAAYPETTLVAQREFDRPVRKAGELRQSIDDHLTEQQSNALTHAYHAGYFTWPRESTAADIAASMDIAETTFHYHLRNALETMSALLVDFGSDSSVRDFKAGDRSETDRG